MASWLTILVVAVVAAMLLLGIGAVLTLEAGSVRHVDSHGCNHIPLVKMHGTLVPAYPCR